MLVRLNNFIVCSSWLEVANRAEAKAILKSIRRNLKLRVTAAEVSRGYGHQVHNYPVLHVRANG